MTTKKQIICKCGHKKGVHQMNGLGKCRIKVKGRLCKCKRFEERDVILQDPKTKRLIMTEKTFGGLK
jgi:hypothetical protein